MRIIGDLTLAGFGQLKNARIENLASDPGVPQSGQIWYNTTDGVYRGFNGTDVITFATGGNTQTILDALAAETSARQAADATLTANLSAETTARTDADAALQAALNTEVTARTDADATLTANLATETTARQAADATLQANLDAETSARVAADSAEAAARAAEDTSIRTDFAAADAAMQSTLQAAVDAEASARAAADDLRVLKAGDSMSGNLAFNGLATVTGLAAPVGASDAATKNYVDSVVSGLSWKQAVDSVGTDLPASAAQGDRFLNTTDDKIYTATSVDTWDAGVASVDGDAVFDRTSETGYVFSGTEWTQFTGTGQVAAGVGLSKNGNQIDVNLGAGIAQLPSDEVGVDVRATGGLWLTEDGATPSTGTDAQLAIRLADASLTLGASGLQLSAGLQSELSAATAAIAAETSARQAADAAETSARVAADDILAANLATETTARQAADAAIAADLATETTARQAADATLQANLDAETTARQAADTAEAAARAAADTALSTRLTNSHFVYDGNVAATVHTVTHNLGVKYCQVLVVDSNDKVILPDSITFNSTTGLTVEFISAITCKVVVTAPQAA